MHAVEGGRRMKLLVSAIVAGGVLVACSDDSSSCGVQGDTNTCFCQDSASGAQTCLPDGSWTECECTGPGSSSDGSSSGVGDAVGLGGDASTGSAVVILPDGGVVGIDLGDDDSGVAGVGVNGGPCADGDPATDCPAGETHECGGANGPCPDCVSGGCEYICFLSDLSCEAACPGGGCSQACAPGSNCVLECPGETLRCPICSSPVGCIFGCDGLRPAEVLCFGGT